MCLKKTMNSLLKDIPVVFQLDFWKGVTNVGKPVDVRVPIHNLESIKTYLEAQDIEYSTMIEDLQVCQSGLSAQGLNDNSGGSSRT